MVKVADLPIFLIALLLVVAAASPYLQNSGAEAAYLTVSDSLGREFIYPLESEETLSFAGPLGNTVLSIKKGAVRVVSSSCPDHICEKYGIAKAKQWIACLPNRLFISIKSQRQHPDKGTVELDDATY